MTDIPDDSIINMLRNIAAIYIEKRCFADYESRQIEQVQWPVFSGKILFHLVLCLVGSSNFVDTKDWLAEKKCIHLALKALIFFSKECFYTSSIYSFS